MSLEKKVKRANLKKLILDSVAAAGTIAFVALLPNVFMGMKKLGLMPHPRQTESIKRTRANLVKQKMLEYSEGKLRITKKGQIYLLRSLGDISRERSKKRKWDGKWRVLIFDIPQERRRDRDLIRQTLRSIGFICLQKSVWIYPYDCEELITLLKADLKIGKNVLYLIVEALEYDKPVREHFGFKS